MILANVALPTFFGHGIFLLIGLLPIALIEGFILQKKIEKINEKRAFNLALQANFKSTIIGIPFAWFSSLLISIPFGYIIGKVNADWGGSFGVVAGHAFLLGGFIHFDPTLSLAASTALLIPYYYMSVYIEFGSIQKKLNGDRREDIKSAVILMNRITYSILATVSLMLIFST